ncbi:MAG: hypothetical protein KDD92_17465 [Caldilineaceae bacterium]|nr:hypothetical protein [Caldilineaceae bacterium]
MNEELRQQIQAAQTDMEPRFKALRSATSALKGAQRLADQEKADALPMQKALVKLEQALTLMEEESLPTVSLQAAVDAFAVETNRALDGLAFDFARDLKESFEERGETVTGRPPTLVVDPLVLQIDIGARKAQWFYGKEALTKPLALSLNAILKAYDQQRKQIVERKTDTDAFLQELYQAWSDLHAEKSRRRINVVEAYSKLVMNRQSGRFWNAPSRSTFKDYDRQFFVRDMVLTRDADPVLTVTDEKGNEQRLRLRLTGATKSQAESASRSLWLPTTPLDGEYYADVVFEEA